MPGLAEVHSLLTVEIVIVSDAADVFVGSNVSKLLLVQFVFLSGAS